MPSILIVEDNADLARGVQQSLMGEGFAVHVARSAEEGAARMEASPADLVVLDLMLPGASGYDLLLHLRASGRNTPVLILSAKGTETDKVRGLQYGADDYMSKPFGVLELSARVKALLRRAGVTPPPEPSQPETIRVRDLEIRPGRRTVCRAGAEIPLRPKEFALLMSLVRRRGETATRRELLHEVWSYDDDVTSRTVDSHIKSLRQKLDPAEGPSLIATVRTIGYRLDA
jgi:two-component system alkaline phosphatase synthesis response regulator PhoP